jgi:hypothetical protein
MNDTRRVKQLGEELGYGHLMALASALWKKDMEDNDYPVSGVFVPTCLSFIKEDLQDLDKDGREI